MGVLEVRYEMNKKMNVVEICIYVLIIVLLIFGVGKVKKDEQPPTNPPAVEVPQNMERVQ